MLGSLLFSFEADDHLPTTHVIVAIVIGAVALSVGAWFVPSPMKLLGLVMYAYPAAGALWLFDRLDTRLGRWATLIVLVAVVYATRSFLGIAGALALFAIPVALAAALLNLSSACIVTVVSTVLAAADPTRSLSGAGNSEICVTLAVIWPLLFVLGGAQVPLYKAVTWSREHYALARELLEKSRDHQAQLKDTLDALAHANRELALANDRLAALRLVAEQARKNKAAFAANLSHELRTPLSIIIGMTELIRDAEEVYGESIPAKAKSAIDVIYRNSEHLENLVNDVLDLSQVEVGRLALQRDSVDVSELLDSALAIVRPLVESKGLALRVLVPHYLPRVSCDPRRIRQVILNLLSNAARHTKTGGITIEGSLQENHLTISVHDTGPGIAPEDTDRIFEPFQSGLKEHAEAHEGSGLGLSISKHFVEMHGGRIWFESDPGRGSTFHFCLPVTPLPAPTRRPESSIVEGWVKRTARAPEPAELPANRIVVYDTGGDLYPLLSRYGDRLEFYHTTSIAEAVETTEQSAGQAILANATNSGELLSLVDMLRARLPDVPILGCVLPQRRLHATLHGARDYLMKPFSRSDVKRILDGSGKAIGRVLVVDDEEDSLHLLAEMVRFCDPRIEVIEASGGYDALEAMRHRSPELVLLDIVMPGVDGWQVLTAKGQEENLRRIPVVLVTAQDPQNQPLSSEYLVASLGAGLPFGKIMDCCESLWKLLTQPD